MIHIPKDIQKYLVRDEIVDKQFELKDHTVFTSINRLFIKKGNTVRDISYSHISSMELKTKPSWAGVIIGTLIIAMTFILHQDNIPWWLANSPEKRVLNDYGTFSLFFTAGTILLGIFLISIGFLWKNHCIKLSVAGMSERLVLTGDKGNLGALFRLLNERRFNPDLPATSPSP